MEHGNHVRSFLQMATGDVTPTQRRSCRLSRRVATLFVLSASVFGALTLADSAWASGSDPSPDPLAGPSDVAATAAQAAMPAAPATPADTQASPAADQSALDAATQQAATAVANASQNNVQNIVVIIRINSPGDDVINQSNTAISNAVATNDSSTNQGTGAGSTGSEPGTPDGTNADGTPTTPTSSSSPPTTTSAQEEPVAAAPPADTPPVGSAASPANKLATPGSERARPRAFAAAQRPSGDSRHASRKAAAVATHAAAAPPATPAGSEQSRQVAPREATVAVPRSTSAPRAGKRWTLVLSAPARAHRAAARAGAGAAQLISNLTRPPALPRVSAEKADQVSTAVVLTLLAVLLAILLGVGSTYVPSVRAWAGR